MGPLDLAEHASYEALLSYRCRTIEEIAFWARYIIAHAATISEGELLEAEALHVLADLQATGEA